MSSTPQALASAKAALDKANKFTNSAVKQAGGTEDAFKPDTPAPQPSYRVARQARQEAGHEFMGIQSNQSGSLNAARSMRAENEKAVNQ
jgi:hypothetical protein